MKCMVCGKDGLDAMLDECPRCHFEFMRQGGKKDDPAFLQAVKQMAEEYEEELKETIGVGLVAYSYEEKDGKLTLNSEKNVTLVEKATDIPKEGIFWFPENFARVESDTPLQLRVFISDEEGKRYEDVSVPVPAEKGLWQVGCKAEEYMSFRLVLGTPAGYSQSESVSLLK